MQNIENPIPRLVHPDWLKTKIRDRNNVNSQKKLTDIFQKVSVAEYQSMMNMGNKESGDEFDEDSDEEVIVPLVAVFEDYREYIKSRKIKWRKMNQDLKSQNPRRGIFNQQSFATDSTWHILQMHETDSPGEFHLWVIIDGQIKRFRVSVPRKIYLQTNAQDNILGDVDSEIIVQKMTKFVKSVSTAIDVLKITLPELLYQRNASIFTNLLNDTRITGIYEASVPLLFKALTKMTSMATLKSQITKKRTDGLIELDNIEFDRYVHFNRFIYNQF